VYLQCLDKSHISNVVLNTRHKDLSCRLPKCLVTVFEPMKGVGNFRFFFTVKVTSHFEYFFFIWIDSLANT